MMSQETATAKIDWTAAIAALADVDASLDVLNKNIDLLGAETMTANNTDMHTIHNARFGVDLIGSTKAARLASDALDSQIDLLAACESAAVSLAICQMPRLDNSVASNEQIMRITLDSLRNAIAKAEPEPSP